MNKLVAKVSAVESKPKSIRWHTIVNLIEPGFWGFGVLGFWGFGVLEKRFYEV